MKSFKVRAEELLACLRDGTPALDRDMLATWKLLGETLKAGGLGPVGIKSSESELQRLRIKCCKLDAKEYLRQLRNEPTATSLTACLLRKRMADACLMAVDIGSTPRELRQLAPVLTLISA